MDIVRGPTHDPAKWGAAVCCNHCGRIQQARPGQDQEAPERWYRQHVQRMHATELAKVRPLNEVVADIRAAIHRGCNHREHRCPCLCGCAELQPCDCGTGGYCSVCFVRIGRGDDGQDGECGEVPEHPLYKPVT